jgi:hypothetical protein
MFNKKYYSCYKSPTRSNLYTCKKFDEFFEADAFTLKTMRNSVCNNLESQTIEVCENIPEFVKNLYLRYALIKSKFDFRMRIEDSKLPRKIQHEIPQPIVP